MAQVATPPLQMPLLSHLYHAHTHILHASMGTLNTSNRRWIDLPHRYRLPLPQSPLLPLPPSVPPPLSLIVTFCHAPVRSSRRQVELYIHMCSLYMYP